MYITRAQKALAVLKLAIAEAKAGLPQHIIKQHWIMDKQSPAAWQAVAAWYRNQPHPHPHIAHILTDLTLMAEARACLTTLTMEQPVAADGLKLAKVRRVQ